MLARLSSKGQIVIPKAVRQVLGLRTGDQLQIRLGEGAIILEPLLSSPIDLLYGRYQDADLLTDLEIEHRQEIENEGAVCA